MEQNLISNNNSIIYCDLLSLIDNNINNLEKIKNQYLTLLSELTICSPITNEDFYQKIKYISSMGTIIVGYINLENDLIELVGSGTVIIEPKIIRGGKSVAHIEDIVVKSSFRGKKISQNILNKLKEFAYNSNCYKIILDCDEKVCPVYKSNGFEIKGVQMGLYF